MHHESLPTETVSMEESAAFLLRSGIARRCYELREPRLQAMFGSEPEMYVRRMRTNDEDLFQIVFRDTMGNVIWSWAASRRIGSQELIPAESYSDLEYQSIDQYCAEAQDYRGGTHTV